MPSTRLTEQDSPYRHLEQMGTPDLLLGMNREDSRVISAITDSLPQMVSLVDAVADHMLAGGRLFYIGAGTSGRLGVLDASECPPTFGVEPGLVIGIIAGGDRALREAVEFAEDDMNQGWKDLQVHHITRSDLVVGITASGSTPYVIGALRHCREQGITTACITCNEKTPVAVEADYPVAVLTGPEFVTGSTRLKAGTAQKLLLNMLSTAVMIRLGRVEDNRMVHMQLTNEKLIDRGVRMVMQELGISGYEQARDWLLMQGSVKKAISAYRI